MSAVRTDVVDYLGTMSALQGARLSKLYAEEGIEVDSLPGTEEMGRIIRAYNSKAKKNPINPALAHRLLVSLRKAGCLVKTRDLKPRKRVESELPGIN